jgi:hypothetical protein
MRWKEIRNANKIIIRNPEEKRPVEETTCRWEDNIKMHIREIGYENVDWIHLAQDRVQWWALVSMVMTFLSSIKCGEFLDLPE